MSDSNIGAPVLMVDVLGFSGCPHLDATVQRIQEIADAMGQVVEVRNVLIHNDEAATTGSRFLGSPTVLIDGIDIEPAARTQAGFSFGCRLYGKSGVPPRGMIEAALREASARR